MKPRVPIWAALVPLLLGIAAYWLWWEREAESFRQAVARVAPGASIGGFPYRIAAELPATRLVRTADGVSLLIAAERAVVNRQPWRTGHVVIAAEQPRLAVAVTFGPQSGARAPLVFETEGPAALASVRRSGDVTERASMRFEQARVVLPFAGAFEATGLELHLRETPSQADRSKGPTLPVQAEARLAGTLSRGALRFAIELPLFVTAAMPITSLQAWRSGGTVEVKGGRLLAGNGAAVAGFDATLAPLADGRVAVAGTIDTDCPATVQAFLEGRVAAAEFRTRRNQRLTLEGSAGDLTVGAAAGPSGGPVRSQEPPCPALRR